MITKKENTMDQLFSFLTIFEWKVWCIVILTIFIVALLMLIFDKLNSYHELHKNNKAEKYQDYIWKSFGILALGHLSGVNSKSKDSLSSRILIFGFYFFCFICIIFYQANLAVFLTVSRLSSTITSINDLLESNIEYNLVGSSSTQVFFEDMKSIEEDFYEFWVKTTLSADSVDNELFWEYPLSNVYTILSNNMKRKGHLNTTEEGNQRVLNSDTDNKFVFFTEYPSALYASKKYCDIQIVGKQFSSRPYAIGVNRKNSLLKEAFNNEILILQREGKLTEMKTKWWSYESANCKETTDSQINMQSIGGLFVIMGFCFILLIIFIVLEFLLCSKKDKTTRI
jgi:hypothetical protein